MQLSQATPPLPEADISDMEFFITQAQIILPVLGVSLLRGTKKNTVMESGPSHPPLEAESPEFTLRYPKANVVARARVVEGEFTVRQGSTAKPGWVEIKAHLGYSALKSKLETDGTLELDPATGVSVFSRDQVFSSPSAAAAVIFGRAANGRKKWKDEVSGQTFGDWQSAGVDFASEGFEFVGEGSELDDIDDA